MEFYGHEKFHFGFPVHEQAFRKLRIKYLYMYVNFFGTLCILNSLTAFGIKGIVLDERMTLGKYKLYNLKLQEKSAAMYKYFVIFYIF